MNNKQIQQIEEAIQQVHASLALALASLRAANTDFETLPLAQKVALEAEWRRVHRKAIWDLSVSLNILSPPNGRF